MARNSRKVERQRRKRQEKQRQMRRAQSGSPYQRIGRQGGVVACYANRGWYEEGQASFYCLCQAPDGGYAMGTYLVDLWCLGLKDTSGHLDITAQEFQENFLDRASKEVDLVRVEPDVVRRIVAGGVRFARENGFRLPKRYERWVALLGVLGEIDSASLEDFGVDDGLRYVGSLEDLKKRLIGCSVEEFLARNDVVAEFGPEFIMSDDEASAVAEFFEAIRRRAVDGCRRWCFANRIQPHPRLDDAWSRMFEAFDHMEVREEEDDETDQGAELESNLKHLISLEDPADARSLSEALEQVQMFMQQFDSPDAFMRQLRLDDVAHMFDQSDEMERTEDFEA